MRRASDSRGTAGPETAEAAGERRMIENLRRGDETAFVQLLSHYHPVMVRLARMYVSSTSDAEDVVQDTWLGVLKGINRFEERSSLKTWMFRILVNRAKTRAQRDGRTIPFSAADEPSVDPDRFHGPAHPQYPGHWASPPRSWEGPEETLLSGETRAIIDRAIAALPATQREVIALRDVEGWPAEEVCGALGLSEANQRVLLHRARSKVRRALEAYLGRN